MKTLSRRCFLRAAVWVAVLGFPMLGESVAPSSPSNLARLVALVSPALEQPDTGPRFPVLDAPLASKSR